MSSGTTCAGVGCHNNSRKVRFFQKLVMWNIINFDKPVRTLRALGPAHYAREGGTEPSVACSFETKISPEESGYLLFPLGR